MLHFTNMDIFAFIRTPNPTKVKVVERERHVGKPWLLEVTIGRTVPLLPVAPDRGESELAASVDKLFEEGGVVLRWSKGIPPVVEMDEIPMFSRLLRSLTLFLRMLFRYSQGITGKEKPLLLILVGLLIFLASLGPRFRGCWSGPY
ncbi:hypothetical protein Tco_0349984 [Tanacetum coccineum]